MPQNRVRINLKTSHTRKKNEPKDIPDTNTARA